MPSTTKFSSSATATATPMQDQGVDWPTQPAPQQRANGRPFT
jgi:hypothetical protein